MSIVRTIHNKENPYVQLNKKALWDENLSLDAVGLWARLLSRPDDWHVSVIELSKSCKCGRDKIYKLLNELIKNGYAYRCQPRVASTKTKKNVFGSYDTYVFEFKVNEEEIKKMFPQTCFPLTENPVTGKADATNKELTKQSSSSILSEEDLKKENNNTKKEVVVDFSKNSFKEEEGEEGLRKVFSKRLNFEQTEEAMTYYKENSLKLSNKENPIGYVIWMIKHKKHVKSEKIKPKINSLEKLTYAARVHRPFISSESVNIETKNIPLIEDQYDSAINETKMKLQTDNNRFYANNRGMDRFLVGANLMNYFPWGIEFPTLNDQDNSKIYFKDSNFKELFEHYKRIVDTRTNRMVI